MLFVKRFALCFLNVFFMGKKSSVVIFSEGKAFLDLQVDNGPKIFFIASNETCRSKAF